MRTEKEIRERMAYLDRWARSKQASPALAGVMLESIDIATKELKWVLGEWDFKTREPKVIGFG